MRLFPNRNRFSTFFILLIIVAGLASFSQVASVNAQDFYPSDDDVNKIAKQLYCPVCENVPLDVCPTQACAQWRELIREQLIAGKTDQEIKQYFVDQYGDRVLAQPPAKGFNWLVYILPPILFIGGIILVVQNLRKVKTSPNIEKIEFSPEDERYLKEMEEALKTIKKSDEIS
jgi:cytochrome c-type biogenesis protein CcmH